jgi:hypothetical protein
VTETIPDFWPANIGETNLITPLTLLKEEASYLGPKTKQLVKADVSTNTLADGQFHHNFVLVVPGLDNYRFGLFQVMHPITLYPLLVSWINSNVSIGTQELFVQKLKEIIGADSTKRIIEALLAQVSGPNAAR